MILYSYHARLPLTEKEILVRNKNFVAKRYVQIRQAREAQGEDPDFIPDQFVEGFHLPATPKGYPEFLKTSRWKAFELATRRQRGSICEGCQKFARCGIFHLNVNRIAEFNPADVRLFCPTCEAQRIPMKPPLLYLDPQIRQREIRTRIGEALQSTENKPNIVECIDSDR